MYSYLKSLAVKLEHVLSVYAYTWLGLLSVNGSAGVHLSDARAAAYSAVPAAIAAGRQVLGSLAADPVADVVVAPQDDLAA